MERGHIQRLPKFFWVPPIIPGTGKATNFNFCMHILSIDRNKNLLQISGKVAGCVTRTLKTFRAVFFAIAQLSCQITFHQLSLCYSWFLIRNVSLIISLVFFQGQGQGSRDTGTFVISRKSLLLSGKWLDCDQTCSETVCQTVCYTVRSHILSICAHFAKHH